MGMKGITTATVTEISPEESMDGKEKILQRQGVPCFVFLLGVFDPATRGQSVSFRRPSYSLKFD